MRAAPVLLGLLLLAGCLTPATEQDPAPEAPAVEAPWFVEVSGALIETPFGLIEVFLYPEHAPVTVANFEELVKAGFYDGLLFHRVVDDFVIQGGDPTGSGVGGSDETVPLEPGLAFSAGALGMARDVQEDSANSQFFITETPQPHLHEPAGQVSELYGKFTVFAQVRRAEYAPPGTLDSMVTVRAIAAVPTWPGLDRPREDVPMKRITLTNLTVSEAEWGHYPLNTTARKTGAGYQVVLETPRALVAGALPTVVSWYVRPVGESAGPLGVPEMRIRGPSGEWIIPLVPPGDAPRVLQAAPVFTEPGEHEVTLLRDGRATVSFPLIVAPQAS